MRTHSLLPIPLLTSLIHAANHDIAVGPRLSYTPNITTASPGDTLTFHFYRGMHNVVQGSFSTPCEFLPTGFYSGFISPETGEANQTFVVKVNDTEAIWYYCSEFMHCQLGMVGVVNPPKEGNDLAAYAAASANFKPNSTTPSEVKGGVVAANDHPLTTTSTSPSSTVPPSETSIGASGTSSPSPTQSTNEGAVVMTGGKMVVSGIGALVALAVFGAGLI